MKRLGIVLFYDKDGVVDDYLTYYLEQLRPFYEEFCVVVNEFLNEEGKRKFDKICDKVLIRKNEGMDVMAYRDAIESYGYEEIKKYDEILLANYTIFGPFYPLKEMYDAMDKKECDLWGVFRWPVYKHQDPNAPYDGYQHVPSFFISYRKSLLNSPHFEEYWRTMKPIKTYVDSCYYHEQSQTPHFENLGFKVETYIDNTKYKDYWKTTFPYGCIAQMIKEDRCPFIKRRQFFIINNNVAFDAGNIEPTIKYLKKHKLYDVRMIGRNIVRTQDINSLRNPKKTLKYYKYKLLPYIFPWYKKRYSEKIKQYESVRDNFLKLFK